MAKKNSYWRKRMEALSKERFQDAERFYQDIQEQYRRALNDVQQDIEIWYQRLADNNDISYSAAKKLLKKDELKEFQWTVEQYIKAGEQSNVNGKWMKELENASAKYHISRLEAMKLQMQQHAELLSAQIEGSTTEYLHKAYGEQYYHTAYEIAVGTGVGSNLTQLNTETIETVLAKPWAADGKVFSDRIWDNKEKLVRNLHTELTQCVIRGEAPKKAIDRLARAMNVSRSQAGNLIMTETAAISAAAQKNCYRDLGVAEFEVVETLDKRTCRICQDMDGRHYPMSDYRIGETAPPFHPRCRGCTCPYYDDEFMAGGQRAARDENGETYYVPADMSYKEWKKTYASGEQMTLDGLVSERGTEYNKPRSVEEMRRVAEKVKQDCTKYSQKASKWSGTIRVDKSLDSGDTLGQKDWNCDIILAETADDGVIWHEMLHSCSVSYYDVQTYNDHQAIEEASVEYLKQQICKEKGITSVDAYSNLIPILQIVNEKFKYGTDLEFAIELFNVPLPDRYGWLEDKVDDSLRNLNVSFSDYNEVMYFIRELEGTIQ